MSQSTSRIATFPLPISFVYTDGKWAVHINQKVYQFCEIPIEYFPLLIEGAGVIGSPAEIRYQLMDEQSARLNGPRDNRLMALAAALRNMIDISHDVESHPLFSLLCDDYVALRYPTPMYWTTPDGQMEWGRRLYATPGDRRMVIVNTDHPGDTLVWDGELPIEMARKSYEQYAEEFWHESPTRGTTWKGQAVNKCIVRHLAHLDLL